MTAHNLKVEIIGFDSGWGCRDYGCEDGPRQISADSIMAKLRHLGVAAKWRGPLGLKHLGDHKSLDTKEKTLPLVVESVRRLANHVKNAIENGHIPIVIGGDHSSAIGTWSGATAATKSFSNFGLLWIDAHLDAHTYETSYQGKFGGWWHGQPVSALTGAGLLEFRTIGGNPKKISPHHICMIGPHSFEPAEKEYVKSKNIRVYDFDESISRGLDVVYQEALAAVTTGTQAFGLTIDLDAFRPEDAPGVGALEDKGLIADDILPIIKGIAHHPLFRCLEIVEYNPHRDVNGKTGQLIEKLIESAFTPR